MCKISVLIPAYNEEKSIGKCVESCLNQTRNPDEIIVVNDGSTDNTLQILKSFGNQIKIIDLEKNTGNKSKAQEIGLNYVHTDIFITTDADIFYYTASLDITFNEEKYWKHQRFLGKLQKIPKFNVVLCTLKKSIEKDGSAKFTIKGDDVYLANDLIKGAYENFYDTAIIVSGDEDFIPAIKTVQTLGKKVVNAFFHKSSSNALRSVCNNCINLGKELKK